MLTAYISMGFAYLATGLGALAGALFLAYTIVIVCALFLQRSPGGGGQ